MKPDAPDVNAAVVSWIREGGTLIYVGDGSDPFHKIDAWWGQRGYANPAEHLFELAGLGRSQRKAYMKLAAGKIVVWKELPARICLSKELADQYRSFGSEDAGRYRHHLDLQKRPDPPSRTLCDFFRYGRERKRREEGIYRRLCGSDDKRLCNYP